jgi:hypothetical protein
MIGEVYPPPGGFSELGGFGEQNLWSSGTKMAPFDQPVLYIQKDYFLGVILTVA